MNRGQTIDGNWKERLRKNAEHDGEDAHTPIESGYSATISWRRLLCLRHYLFPRVKTVIISRSVEWLGGAIFPSHIAAVQHLGGRRGQKTLRGKMAAQWEELWR